MTNWEPVQVSERYPALDLLRGFALFGVLMVNLQSFFRISVFEHILHFHSDAGAANHAIDFAVAWFLEFKAIALFSVTFGASLAIQAERAGRRGVWSEAFLARRFLILFALGMVHMVLVSNVDILVLYSVCGLLIVPLLRLPAVIVVLAGLAAVFLPAPLTWVGPSLPPEPVLREHAANATRIYGQGNFAAILAFRWHETKELIVPLLLGVAQRTFGLMLIGVSVWRSGVLRQAQSHRRLLWAIGVVAGAIAVIAPGSELPLAVAYAAALVAWQRSESCTGWLAPVAALGRMALSNYLAQSIIFGLIFYGYGFGLFRRLTPALAAVLGVAVYASQLAFSSWWLNRYRFGPVEWLWRSLTYGRRQPLRLS